MTCSYKISPTDEFLYRYEGHVYYFENGESKLDIYLRKYPIMRKTRACDVIDHYGQEKFVQRHARKRYAYPSLEQAAESFKIRCRWRIGYAERALQGANEIEELRKELLC